MKVLLLDCINSKYDISTYKVVQKLVEGIESTGSEINIIKINDLDIKPCFACTAQSSFQYDSKCRCDDDMNNLYPEFRKSDIWIFAAHINSNGATHYLKNLLDRLEPLFQPMLALGSGPDLNFPANDNTKGKIMLISSFDGESSYLARNISDYIDSLSMLFSKEPAGNIIFDADRIDENRLKLIYQAGKEIILND